MKDAGLIDARTKYEKPSDLPKEGCLLVSMLRFLDENHLVFLCLYGLRHLKLKDDVEFR